MRTSCKRYFNFRLCFSGAFLNTNVSCFKDFLLDTISMISSFKRADSVVRSSIISCFKRTYTTALTRKVPSTLTKALSMDVPASPVDVSKALAQHDEYVRILNEKVGLATIEVEADDKYPDCVFIEDTAVIISNVAVINRIGASSRQGEVSLVKETLQNLGLVIHDMREEGNDITLDGGDVMYPVDYVNDNGLQKLGGEHLFVGLSSRTNQKGVQFLSERFPDVSVIGVDISHLGSLHLKSIVTHLDESTIIAPKGQLGDELIRTMNAKELGYEVVQLNDITACNVVTANNHVLAQPTKCKETMSILESVVTSRGKTLHWVDMSEFTKLDGALTCQSILF